MTCVVVQAQGGSEHLEYQSVAPILKVSQVLPVIVKERLASPVARQGWLARAPAFPPGWHADPLLSSALGSSFQQSA